MLHDPAIVIALTETQTMRSHIYTLPCTPECGGFASPGATLWSNRAAQNDINTQNYIFDHKSTKRQRIKSGKVRKGSPPPPGNVFDLGVKSCEMNADNSCGVFLKTVLIYREVLTRDQVLKIVIETPGLVTLLVDDCGVNRKIGRPPVPLAKQLGKADILNQFSPDFLWLNAY